MRTFIFVGLLFFASACGPTAEKCQPTECGATCQVCVGSEVCSAKLPATSDTRLAAPGSTRNPM